MFEVRGECKISVREYSTAGMFDHSNLIRYLSFDSLLFQVDHILMKGTIIPHGGENDCPRVRIRSNATKQGGSVDFVLKTVNYPGVQNGFSRSTKNGRFCNP